MAVSAFTLDTKLKINAIAKNAGCNLFLDVLKERHLIAEVERLIQDVADVAIFCPIDAAFERLYRTKLPSNERDILLNHIAFKHDKRGVMYNTLAGGRIVLNPVGGKDGKEVRLCLSWVVVFIKGEGVSYRY